MAVSHSRVFETAVASGVDSCEVNRVSSFVSRSVSILAISISCLHWMSKKQTECQIAKRDPTKVTPAVSRKFAAQVDTSAEKI